MAMLQDDYRHLKPAYRDYQKSLKNQIYINEIIR